MPRKGARDGIGQKQTTAEQIETVRDFVNDMREEAKDLVEDAKDLVDDLLYSREAFALGVGLFLMGSAGLAARHPEIGMFLAAEAGDVAEELMSEIGGLTTAVEVGGD